MTIVVIEPPKPAVTAAEARAVKVFSEADDDDYINLLLSVAQSRIDGPDGWLRQAVGEQTLEFTTPRFCGPSGFTIQLPYGPAIGIEGIVYDDAGETHTISSDDYVHVGDKILPAEGFSWPRASLPRIRYRAGYPVVNGKGTVPPAIRHAIILMAADLKSVGGMSGAVRRETVDGVGTVDYVLPDAASSALNRAAETLLRGLRAPRV